MIDLLEALIDIWAGLLFLIFMVRYLRAARRYGEYIRQKYPEEATRIRKYPLGDSLLSLGMLRGWMRIDPEIYLKDSQLCDLRRKASFLFACATLAILALPGIGRFLQWLVR
jgi:hypothetical protein